MILDISALLNSLLILDVSAIEFPANRFYTNVNKAYAFILVHS